jgi:hypothetical protein
MAQKAKQPNPIITAIRRLMKMAGRQTVWFYLALAFDLLQAVIVVLNAALMRIIFDAVLA